MTRSSWRWGITVVLVTNSWTGEIPGWENIAPAMRTLKRKVARLTVKNGNRPPGCWSRPRQFTALPRRRPWGDAGGRRDVHRRDGYQHRARRPRCRRYRPPLHLPQHDVANISDRLRSVAALRMGQVEGPVLVEDCRFLAVPQVGLLLDGARSGRPLRIRRNTFQQRTVVTNGYAIAIAGSRNFEIAENRISAENGRGIDVDSYRREPVEDG
ncbi:MAG: right-handed parallel beta-helix repeat-containing protein [Gemmataceae bacterium]